MQPPWGAGSFSDLTLRGDHGSFVEGDAPIAEGALIAPRPPGPAHHRAKVDKGETELGAPPARNQLMHELPELSVVTWSRAFGTDIEHAGDDSDYVGVEKRRASSKRKHENCVGDVFAHTGEREECRPAGGYLAAVAVDQCAPQRGQTTRPVQKSERPQRLDDVLRISARHALWVRELVHEPGEAGLDEVSPSPLKEKFRDEDVVWAGLPPPKKSPTLCAEPLDQPTAQPAWARPPARPVASFPYLLHAPPDCHQLATAAGQETGGGAAASTVLVLESQ